jgi:protoheme ferro-lyase
LWKAIKKLERKKEDEEEDPNIRSYKPYKTKEDFDSALNNKVQKAKQQKPIKRKSEKDEIFEF